MVSRVSSKAQHETIVADIGKSQAFLADMQKKISSGQKADSFSGMGNSISRIIDLEARIQSADKYQSRNEVIKARLSTMKNSVDIGLNVAKEFRNLLVQEKSSAGSVLDITTAANTLLLRTADALNANLNGRFLFAGGKTASPPVDTTAIQDLELIYDENGELIAPDDYYDGDGETFTVQASDSLELEYGINANDPAFRKLIGALQHAKDAELQSGQNKDDMIGEAIDMINDAISQITQMQYEVNSNIVTLNTANEIHKTVEVELTDFLGKEQDADVVEASIKINLGQATLTALMQTFTKISQLKLSDYLR